MSENTSIKELAAQIMPCDTNKPYAFVSYSKQDYAKVYPCIISLQQTGCNIWVDKNMEEQADHSWTDLAFEAIQNKNCVAIIFMISSNSLISVPCFNEVMYSQRGQLTLNRHRNNPVKLITVNTDSVWNPRRTHFSQWVYDESDKYNDDSAHNLGTADSTLLDDLGEMIEPRKKFNIPTSGDVATAFMNDVYGGAKEIDRTTVLPIESIGAILKNISETMDKPEAAADFISASEPAPVRAAAPAEKPAPAASVHAAEQTAPAAPVRNEAPAAAVATAAPAAIQPNTAQPAPADGGFIAKLKKKKLPIIIAAAAVCVVAAVVIIIAVVSANAPKEVTDMVFSSDLIAYNDGYPVVQGKYTGTWQRNMPNGTGTLTFDNDTYYTGEWVDGMANGQGKALYPSGSVFEGEWANSRRNGNGTHTTYYENGEVKSIFEGLFKDDLSNGQGKLTLYDESGKVTSVYEGEYKDSKKNGQGKLTEYDENEKVTVVFESEYKDGKMNGQSKNTHYDENGKVTSVFEGEYKDGNVNGHCKRTEYDENEKVTYVFEGEYKDGKKNGQGTGTAYDENGKVTFVFEGEHKDGSANGQGKRTNYDENGKVTDVYEGEYKDGKLNGQGKRTNYDESGKVTAVFEGNFIDGSANGQGTGTAYDENGKVTYIFEGEYKDGSANGHCKRTNYDENGNVTSVKEGEWKDGKFTGGNSGDSTTQGTTQGNNDAGSNDAANSKNVVRYLRVHSTGDSTADAEWARSNDEGKSGKSFQIQLFEDSAYSKMTGETTTDKLKITLNNLTKGDTYYFKIRATYEEDGTESYSEWTPFSFTFTGNTSVLPGSTNARVYAGEETAYTVKWNGVADATGYQVGFFPNSDPNSEYYAVYVYDDANRRTVGLRSEKGRESHLGVRAVKTVNGEDIYSEWTRLDFTFTGDTSKLPNAPQNFKAVVSPEKSDVANLSWDAVSEATGYQLCGFKDPEHKAQPEDYTWFLTDSKTSLGPMVNGKTYYYGVRAVKTVDGMDTYSDWTYITYTHNPS